MHVHSMLPKSAKSINSNWFRFIYRKSICLRYSLAAIITNAERNVYYRFRFDFPRPILLFCSIFVLLRQSHKVKQSNEEKNRFLFLLSNKKKANRSQSRAQFVSTVQFRLSAHQYCFASFDFIQLQVFVSIDVCCCWTVRLLLAPRCVCVRDVSCARVVCASERNVNRKHPDFWLILRFFPNLMRFSLEQRPHFWRILSTHFSRNSELERAKQNVDSFRRKQDSSCSIPALRSLLPMNTFSGASTFRSTEFSFYLRERVSDGLLSSPRMSIFLASSDWRAFVALMAALEKISAICKFLREFKDSSCPFFPIYSPAQSIVLDFVQSSWIWIASHRLRFQFEDNRNEVITTGINLDSPPISSLTFESLTERKSKRDVFRGTSLLNGSGYAKGLGKHASRLRTSTLNETRSLQLQRWSISVRLYVMQNGMGLHQRR